jgi:hypothetical protein
VTATLSDIESVVARLNRLRAEVVERQVALRAADPRTEDIIWPCVAYQRVGSARFESDNACLVAEESTATLWLSFPILTDLINQLPESLRGSATDWFFLHQLVHVAQGLAYDDFRALNRVGNRHETMRADCAADFISLKTVAMLTASADGRPLVRQFHSLLSDTLPNMIAMEPNLFIPRRRDIEILRIFALLLLRYYFSEAVTHDLPALNASIFPWWSDDYSECYVFVDQVNALGRGCIDIDPQYLRRILDLIRAGDADSAYGLICGFAWPRLNDCALPTRLMSQ